MKLPELTPRLLSVLLFFVFIFVAWFIYPFVSAVFRGDLIANQTIAAFKVDYLDIFGFKLAFSDFSIRMYSLLVLCGLFTGYFITLFLVQRSFLPNTIVDRLIIGLVLFGILGGRIFYVLFNLPFYFGQVRDVQTFFDGFLKVLMVFEGGMSIIGALLACVAYLFWFCKKYGFVFLEVVDTVVPGLAIGQAIGRWGNFFNYEAYGAPTNVYWKMYVPENAINGNKYVYPEALAQFFHPTFLYESVPMLILGLILLYKYSDWTIRSSGMVFAWYLIGYGVIRTVTELFRLDALMIPVSLKFGLPEWLSGLLAFPFPNGVKEPMIYSLSNLQISGLLVSQMLAVGMVLAGIHVLFRRRGVVYSKQAQKDLGV